MPAINAALGKAGLALKRLGRAEWSEIKAMQAPTTLLVRMMGAVRPTAHPPQPG